MPDRLLCPWDFPGKNTGVGCHFLLQNKILIFISYLLFLKASLCTTNLGNLLTGGISSVSGSLESLTPAFSPGLPPGPARAPCFCLWAQSPFSLNPKTSTLLRPGASLLSDSARDEALTGSSYSSCLLFFILGLSPAISFFFTLSSLIRLQQNPSLLSPPSLSSGVFDLQRHSGVRTHITRRSPKSSRAELRNHLSGLGTQVSPSSSSCLHPCASGTLCG